MNSIPLELFYEIIGYIDDKGSLGNCSLVAKSWEDPSRKRLFKYIQTPPGSLETWLERISQGRNGTLLEHVYRLTCNDEFSWTLLYPDQPESHDAFRGHYRSLRRLRHLKLCTADIDTSLQVTESVFSVFRNTLSCITLLSCGVSKSLIPTLVNCLPNLQYLCLKDVDFIDSDSDEESTLSISRSPLKRLSIGEQSVESLGFLSRLWELELRFDEIILLPSFIHFSAWAEVANYVICTFGTSAKCLRIPNISNTPVHLTLSPCHELHELELEVFWDPLYHEGLISSIPSKNIRKIIINHGGSWPVGNPIGTRLDAILSELSERLGCEIGLEFNEGVRELEDF